MSELENMARHLDAWHSPRLEKEMPIVRYGDYGMPVLIFPTAAADYLEYERFRLIDAIAPYIRDGMVNVFSINSINKDAWVNDEIAPDERARRQVAYDRYVRDEVVPYIHKACQKDDIGIVTSGASFGAFHAMNETLKHPDVFSGTIAMSGCFDIRSCCDGHHDLNVYFNNPVEYVPNMVDPALLGKIRAQRLTIVTGQGDYENPEMSKEMASVLERRDIPVNLDLWGTDVPHDWASWNKMLLHYLPLYANRD